MTINDHVEPCWVLHYADGTEVDSGDGPPHYPIEADASTAAGRYEDAQRGVPTPGRATECCVTLSCGGCGTPYGGGAWAIDHFPNREMAFRESYSAGWKARAGDVYCSKECLNKTRAEVSS